MLTTNWFLRGQLITHFTAVFTHFQSLVEENWSSSLRGLLNFEEIAFSLFPLVAAAKMSSMLYLHLLSDELLSIVRRVKHLIAQVFNRCCKCTCQLKNS